MVSAEISPLHPHLLQAEQCRKRQVLQMRWMWRLVSCSLHFQWRGTEQVDCLSLWLQHIPCGLHVQMMRRSRSFSNSEESPYTPAKKRTIDEFMKIKMDLEIQDVMCMRGKCDPSIAILLLMPMLSYTWKDCYPLPEWRETWGQNIDSTRPPWRGRIWESMWCSVSRIDQWSPQPNVNMGQPTTGCSGNPH